jgi:hypothetical protein
MTRDVYVDDRVLIRLVAPRMGGPAFALEFEGAPSFELRRAGVSPSHPVADSQRCDEKGENKKR